jgi:phage terminase Nu1 subunit (DNA packaging protein)
MNTRKQRGKKNKYDLNYNYWICKAKREKPREEKLEEDREEKSQFHIGNV